MLLFGIILASCGGTPSENNHETETNEQTTGVEFDTYNQKISYCIGLDHARGAYNAFTAPNVKDAFDILEIKNGMVDYLVGNELRILPWEKDSLLDLYLMEDGSTNDEAVSKADASYCVGMDEAFALISSLVARKIDQEVDVDYMVTGVIEGLSGMNKPTIAYMDARREVDKYYADINKENGASFLEENRGIEGILETESGLQYEIISEGSGPKPNLTDSVTMHYTGRFIDGRVFDSTIPSGIPYSNTVINLIPGWQEGLMLMREGAQFRLYIPSELGYGEKGMGVVEPNATLIFDIELLQVKRYQ